MKKEYSCFGIMECYGAPAFVTVYAENDEEALKKAENAGLKNPEISGNKEEIEEDDGTLAYRVIFSNSKEQRRAEKLLDKNSENYDYDGGDRMMLSFSGLQLLAETNIDYDEV